MLRPEKGTHPGVLQLTREKLKTTLMQFFFFGGVVWGTRHIMGNVKIVNWWDLRKCFNVDRFCFCSVPLVCLIQSVLLVSTPMMIL